MNEVPLIRIVAVADTHGFDFSRGLPTGDVFVHAGDLLEHGNLTELEEAAVFLKALPHRHKIVIAGNHDWPFVHSVADARAMMKEAGVTYLQDRSVTIEGITLYGSPWQPDFMNWAFNRPRGPELAKAWKRVPEGVDVLVTHTPPIGTGDLLLNGHRVGCEDLFRRIVVVRPVLHLFGHIHEDGGSWQIGSTLHVNATLDRGRRGASVIDYDAEGHRASLIVAPPKRGKRFP